MSTKIRFRRLTQALSLGLFQRFYHRPTLSPFYIDLLRSLIVVAHSQFQQLPSYRVDNADFRVCFMHCCHLLVLPFHLASEARAGPFPYERGVGSSSLNRIRQHAQETGPPFLPKAFAAFGSRVLLGGHHTVERVQFSHVRPQRRIAHRRSYRGVRRRHQRGWLILRQQFRCVISWGRCLSEPRLLPKQIAYMARTEEEESSSPWSHGRRRTV